MPLSEFDKQVTRMAGGRIRVTGTVEPERDAQGTPVPRKVPVQFHFLIVQDGRVVSGQAAASLGRWTGTTTAVSGLHDGSAQACGVAVVARESPIPSFETFTWFENVEVTS